MKPPDIACVGMGSVCSLKPHARWLQCYASVKSGSPPMEICATAGMTHTHFWGQVS